MRTLLLSSFIVFAYLTSATEFSPTIIGGAPVGANDPVAKVTVALTDTNGRIACSAVILSHDTLLTAGHCTDFRQIVFSHDVRVGTPRRQVTRVLRHPSYRERNVSSIEPHEVLPAILNDLAIFKFEGGLPPGYRAATLPRAGTQPRDGSRGTAAGFGVNSSGSVDGRLRKLRTFARHGEEFRAGMLNEFSKFIVRTSPSQAPCFGDSGGPVLSGETVIGVASHRMSHDIRYACDCRALVYTNVGDYVAWIKSNI